MDAGQDLILYPESIKSNIGKALSKGKQMVEAKRKAIQVIYFDAKMVKEAEEFLSNLYVENLRDGDRAKVTFPDGLECIYIFTEMVREDDWVLLPDGPGGGYLVP